MRSFFCARKKERGNEMCKQVVKLQRLYRMIQKTGQYGRSWKIKESDSCGFVKNVEMQGEGDRVLENL